jgi:hypothetical protein
MGIRVLKHGAKFFQGFAQMGTRTMNPGFDRGGAGIERGCDLVVAEVLLLEEKNGLALLGGQVLQGAMKGPFDFCTAI